MRNVIRWDGRAAIGISSTNRKQQQQQQQQQQRERADSQSDQNRTFHSDVVVNTGFCSCGSSGGYQQSSDL
ncbi:hypothetical protein G9P44_003407 [Scheffersomyces stipitis]|nr:hypothetical protein G9P44_003407 [Scheffersomyces stipitis]